MMIHSPHAAATHRWIGRRNLFMTLLTIGGLVILSGTADAQSGADHYHPLSQNSPPGQAAAWLNYLRKYDPSWLQPLLIEVPGSGTVEVFSGANHPVGAAPAPALVAANAGHLYRLRISNMEQFPDVEIYPTVELLDRLHPPAGRENDFPIPVILTADDIRTALGGQLVTRVVYLEQPQLAQVMDPLRREIPQSMTPAENALKEADRLGRPMAILRIGGRQPSPGSPASFYGTGGMIQFRDAADRNEGGAVVRMKNHAVLQRTAVGAATGPTR
ncbi:MAG: hypothetical protein RIK87_30200 [Fuerstiella sp.]